MQRVGLKSSGKLGTFCFLCFFAAHHPKASLACVRSAVNRAYVVPCGHSPHCARQPYGAAALLYYPKHRLLRAAVASPRMASSSALRGVARATPPPNQFAAFRKLVDKRMIAGVLCRFARAVELAAQASVDAAAFFGGDSLVLADLHICGCTNLNSSAVFNARGAEQEALLRRSWALLVLVIPILLRRLDANTLLPGTLREEEMDYAARTQAVARKVKNEPVLQPVFQRETSSTFGYNLLLCAALMSLKHLMHPHPSWPAAERRSVESFVLGALDVISRTAGMPACMALYEAYVVSLLEQYMNTHYFEPAFCASVLCKWRSEAVSSVLRARGVLQTGIAKCKQDNADFMARQLADIAKHWLRDCALPSCSKT